MLNKDKKYYIRRLLDYPKMFKHLVSKDKTGHYIYDSIKKKEKTFDRIKDNKIINNELYDYVHKLVFSYQVFNELVNDNLLLIIMPLMV